MEAPVLVVDDEPDARDMLATMLTFAGFTVATAENGRVALSQARQHRPCVILLDLMMPVMDGEQFRQMQQRDPELQDVPVVIVSARHDVASVAARLGVEHFAPKPLDFDRIVGLVSDCCG